MFHCNKSGVCPRCDGRLSNHAQRAASVCMPLCEPGHCTSPECVAVITTDTKGSHCVYPTVAVHLSAWTQSEALTCFRVINQVITPDTKESWVIHSALVIRAVSLLCCAVAVGCLTKLEEGEAHLCYISGARVKYDTDNECYGHLKQWRHRWARQDC